MVLANVVLMSPTFHGGSSSLMKFTRERVINFHNNHFWADENPLATRPHGFQQSYGFNMKEGFLDGCVIGPYLLPPNLTGDV